MRACVTGAAGFVGSHLVDHLLATGHDVVGLDDLSSGRPENLADALDDEHFELVKGSVLDHDIVDSVVADTDIVFHLAAAVGVEMIVDSPIESLRTNIDGTEAVLGAALRHDTGFLLTSTSEVYGKNTSDGLTEDSDRVMGSPLMSRWSYAEAKALDESLTHMFVERRGLKGRTVRLFNTVGPRQTSRYGMVIPRFVDRAVRGEPIPVYGDGRQRRVFCFVGDVVGGIAALGTHPGAIGKVFNLGGNEEVTIEELALRVIALSDSASEIVRVPYDEAYGPGYEDMMRRVPDSTRARDLVGFRPSLGLDDILGLVIEERRRHDSVD